jgi:hypothetical protein
MDQERFRCESVPKLTSNRIIKADIFLSKGIDLNHKSLSLAINFIGSIGINGTRPRILKVLGDVHPPTPSKFGRFPTKNGRATSF